MSKSSSKNLSQPPVTGPSDRFAELLSIPIQSSCLESPTNQPGVYILSDEDGACLYIGHSQCIRHRLSCHQNTKKWWPRVAALDVIIRITDEDGRLTRETIEILRHRPRYNQIIYLGLTADGRIYPARFR